MKVCVNRRGKESNRMIIANLVTCDLTHPFGERAMSTDHFCFISLSIEKKVTEGC